MVFWVNANLPTNDYQLWPVLRKKFNHSLVPKIILLYACNFFFTVSIYMLASCNLIYRIKNFSIKKTNIFNMLSNKKKEKFIKRITNTNRGTKIWGEKPKFIVHLTWYQSRVKDYNVIIWLRSTLDVRVGVEVGFVVCCLSYTAHVSMLMYI